MTDVGAWLEGLGFVTYAKVFADNAIEADVVPDLTDADLEKLGIPLGHRKKLLKAIEALKAGANASDMTRADAARDRPPAAPVQAERRQLTVMFVDLVGSTELSLKLDPEELRDLIRGYQDALGREVVRYGGHVAKYMGDGALVYFGYPQAHEDDAVRAIYAGLAATRAVKRLGKRALEAHGGRLRARIGIATGVVVIGDLVGAEGSEAGAVTGDTPNLAFRLQEIAGSGRVAVAERTRALAGDAFTYEAEEERTLKGFPEPARLWRVLGPSGAESRFEALHGRWLTPLVGREHELALLLDRWQQAKDGDGQVVLIAGEAGIGKSRIIEVLRERILADDHVRLRFHCSPYHTNSALHPVIEHMERAAGFERDEPAEARLDKLEALIGQAGAPVTEVAPLFAALLSIPTGDRYPPRAMSPERQKERTLAALADQVAGLARSKPILMIVEDAHWIDPTTLESVDLAIARAEAQRLLLVVTYRPEFLAKWTGRPNVTLITMNRLSKRQGATMVDGITGGRALPAEVLEQVVARTDGVPLFVEELTRMVVESGLLREEAGRYVLDGPLPPLAIPATLHDSLMARLDRFAPAKEVAQAAAAIGRTFGHELLAAVLDMKPAKLDAALEQLVESGLVFRQGTGVEATYTFKHALVQDAAYQSLLKSQRQRLHARIANVLEKLFPEEAQTSPELMAQHYAEAGLSEPAITWYAKAGLKAAGHSANAEAVASFEKALAHIDSSAGQSNLRDIELDVLTGLGVALMAIKGYASPEVGRAYMRARTLCQDVDDPERVFRVLCGIWSHFFVSGNFSESWTTAEALGRLASEGQNSGALCASHSVWGQEYLDRGRFSASIEHFEKSVALGDRARDRASANAIGENPTATSLAMGGYALWFRGHPERANRWCLDGIAVARESEHIHSVAQTLGWHATVVVCCGGVDHALAKAHEFLAYTTANGLALWATMAGMHLDWARSRSESDQTLPDSILRRLATFRALGGVGFVWTFVWAYAEVCLAQGVLGDSLGIVESTLTELERSGEACCIAELMRLRGELLLARDTASREAAEQCFVDAVALAHEQEAKSLELRAAMSLARLWAERGERQRAHDLLAPVHGWFTEGFGTRDLKDAKALLDQIA